MSQTAARRWTSAEFFDWQARQEERYELVGGFPLRLMAGAKNSHDDIAVNILVALGTRLRGGGCRPFTSDGAVETYAGQIRRPDAGVDCGSRDPNAFTAAEPKMVVEILSPSTRDFDTIEKVPEYKAVDSIDYILVVEPNAPDVIVWSRGSDRDWERSRIEDLSAAVAMPSLGVELPLAEIYGGVAFASPPPLRFGLT